MAASDTPDSRSASDCRENTSHRVPTPENTQLSDPNGVSTNVSSVAMDRGLLGGGLLNRGLQNPAGAPPSSSVPGAMANSIVRGEVSRDEAVSDVDVMLRVKTGDESAFAYL